MSEKKSFVASRKDLIEKISANQKVEREVVEKFLSTKGLFEKHILDGRKFQIENEK